MSNNWAILKGAVSRVIKTNGNQEITGQLLQATLHTIIDSLGAAARCAGIATPTTNPGAPDGPVFYFALEAGNYSNFDGAVVRKGFTILSMTKGQWQAHEVFAFTTELGDSDSLVMTQKSVTELFNTTLEKLAWHKIESEEKLEEMIKNGELNEDTIYYVEEPD